MKNYTHNDIIHAFTNALADFGIAPRESIVFDTFIRFHVEGDSKGSKNAFYILHSNGLPAGHFGCNKRGIAENWCIKNANELTDIERAEFHAQMATAKATREKSDAEKHHAARIDAEKRITTATTPASDNPHQYLINKNVQGYGVLIEGENLLIPARDVNGKPWTVQTISPNGDKRFQAGGKKQGNFHLIGKEIEKNGFNQLIVLVEGYATGATAYDTLNKKYPVAVCFDSGNLEPVALALREKYPRLKILIVGDNDAFNETNTGKDKAQKAFYALTGGAAYVLPDFTTVTKFEIQAAMLASQNSGDDWGNEKSAKRKQQIERLKRERLAEYNDRKPTDFNDMAAWLGVARVREQLENGVESIGLITVEGGKLPQIIKKIEGEMIFNSGNLYQRAGSLVRAIHTEKAIEEKGVTIPANTLTIHAINESYLSCYFTKIAKWQKYDKRFKCYERIDAESKYAHTYFSLVGDWNLPVLRGIIECPTLRRDGSLLLKNGYDKASCLYVDYQGEPVNVLNNPTKQDALDALEILKQPLKDFSFLAEIDRAVILAAMLTAVVNYSIPTTPWFAIDAPIMGSGKSLLADIVSMIATGRKATVISQGNDETEDEKRLGALLMRGVPLLNLDNIERPVSGDMICSMTTQTQVSIRQLGQSKMIDLPTNCTKLATGNNIVFKGDMTRRVLLCQLDPQCERPDARKFDIDLNEWIPANRHRLLSAALTVLRGYIHAGKPLAGQITPYGSFDDWNNLIRASLLWLGVDDPMDTRQRLESSDPVKSELGAVLALWNRAFSGQGKTTAEIAESCELSQNADLKHALMDVAGSMRGGNVVDARRLGYWLKKYQNRVEGGLRFEKSGVDSHSKVVFWIVRKVAGYAGNAGNDSKSDSTKGNEVVNAISKDMSENITRNHPHNPQITPDSDIEEF
jgi:phage/plasmid primase-like uncharacterized protein